MVSKNLARLGDAYTDMYADLDVLGILGLAVGSALGFLVSAVTTAVVLDVATGDPLVDDTTDALLASAVGILLLGAFIYIHNRTGGGVSLLFSIMAIGVGAGTAAVERPVSSTSQSLTRILTRSPTARRLRGHARATTRGRTRPRARAARPTRPRRTRQRARTTAYT